ATVALRDRGLDSDIPPTTRVMRAAKSPMAEDAPRTQLVRGKQKVSRGEFVQDPVVGWLVVVGGPGLGAFRPIFEGNNTIGRAKSQRIPLDFGDDAISSEEQAYIRYDSAERSYLFVPNLAKTNVVSVNEKRPTGAVELAHMDVITMGRTQLVFVPFCGAEFDWSELQDVKD
ncbi:MAG: FHA domain-containing protein, partial [Hyphomicrobiaceae bacterium]